MGIQIDGILLDPYGNVARFADIKFVTIQGANDVIESSSAVFRADENGAYSIDVQFGRFAVFMRFNGSNGAYEKIQTITVNSDTVASTLGELLEYTEPLTPGEIVLVQQLVAQAIAARDSAEAAALAALLSEQNAAASASEAEGWANQAAGSVALLAPVPLNGGVWAAGQTFTAYNQYMIYNGEAYSPRQETTLPYVVGATPDLGFVYQIKLNSLQALSGLTDPSDLDGFYRRAATVAEVQAGNYKAGDKLTLSDRAGANFDVVAGGVPNGFDVLDALNGNTAVYSGGSIVDIKYFGSTGADGENIAPFLEAAKNVLASNVYVYNKSAIVSPNVQMFSQQKVHGAGGPISRASATVITSGVISAAQLNGITHLYTNPSMLATQPQSLAKSVTPKLLARQADGAGAGAGLRKFVLYQATNKGYTRYQLEDEKGEAGGSYGVDYGLLRVFRVDPTLFAYVCKNIHSGKSTGTTIGSGGAGVGGLDYYFVSDPVGHTYKEGNIVGGDLKYNTVPASAGASEYIEYTIKTGGGDLTGNVMFFSSGGSSNAVEISVNGTIIKTVATSRAAVGGSNNNLITIPVEFGRSKDGNKEAVVRITNKDTTTKPAYVVCCNWYELKDHNGQDFDSWKTFRDMEKPYFAAVGGAVDYAIFDANISKWMGSSHGGEISESVNLRIDGADYDFTSFPVNSVIVGKAITIYQRTYIGGATIGTSQLSSYSITDFSSDYGYSFDASMDGEWTTSSMYTMMSPVDPSFDFIVNPRYIDLSSEGQTVPLGQRQLIVSRNQTTGQEIRSSGTCFDTSLSSVGGCWVFNEPSLYRKIYNGPVIQSLGTIREISFTSVREFLR